MLDLSCHRPNQVDDRKFHNPTSNGGCAHIPHGHGTYAHAAEVDVTWLTTDWIYLDIQRPEEGPHIHFLESANRKQFDYPGTVQLRSAPSRRRSLEPRTSTGSHVTGSLGQPPNRAVRYRHFVESVGGRQDSPKKCYRSMRVESATIRCRLQIFTVCGQSTLS